MTKRKSTNFFPTVIQEWTTVIKEKDKLLRNHNDNCGNDNLPPIRKFSNSNITTIKKPQSSNSTTNRIKSCDYEKWDKYDADTETLKIDLNEEINREKTLIENKKKENKPKLIEPIEDDSVLRNLTEIEKENLAEK